MPLQAAHSCSNLLLSVTDRRNSKPYSAPTTSMRLLLCFLRTFVAATARRPTAFAARDISIVESAPCDVSLDTVCGHCSRPASTSSYMYTPELQRFVENYTVIIKITTLPFSLITPSSLIQSSQHFKYRLQNRVAVVVLCQKL